MKSLVHIETARRGKVTYLKRAFFSPPLKVANITEDKTACELQLMLMSSSPGVLDGDEYQIQIDVAEGCSLHVQTQSYQRLFSMTQGAVQRVRVSMDKGSSFCYLPHPSVPHEGSHFSVVNRIDLSEGCSLIWGDVLTCGRKLTGEIFQFSSYHSQTNIFIRQRLVIKENLLVKPAAMNWLTLGQGEGFTHQASLIYLNEQAPVPELIETLHAYLAQQADLLFGITTAPVNGLLVRLLGQRGEQLHTCLKTIAKILPQTAIDAATSVVYAD